ncbi:M20/M25/M40 family metallo-hydrolase [Ignatzschineria indica]|uniref:M20/M25/M40 family metallo-hydrolase n=1 Tax=Ignatzschineria indica TaxID=472583 RepID=UPI00362F75B7
MLKYRNFAGTAILIFQPAEEGRGGAEQLVVKENFLARYPLDAIYAMHNWPTLPAGTFAIKPGSIMASSDRIFITIKGQSGHAGLPQLTQDPLLVATHIYQGIQGLVARTVDPLSPLVVAITQIQVERRPMRLLAVPRWQGRSAPMMKNCAIRSLHNCIS